MTERDGDPQSGLEILECRTDAEIQAAYPVIRQLRESLDLDAFLTRVKQAEKGGYRLFCGRLGGRIVGALGLRIQDDLCWGHNLYVDDLVVDESLRRKRFGESLMRFAEELGRADNCEYVRLASGMSRIDTHRFYERLGYRRTSFAFALKL